jgi:hypothetical protein
MTLGEYKRKFDSFYSGLMQTVEDEVKNTLGVLVDLNTSQLMYGRDADAELLTPSYPDDPYFKGNKKRADNYMKMKKRLAPVLRPHVQLFPEKPEETPNLIVTGTWFHNYFYAKADGGKYTIGSTGMAADDIQKKYESYGHRVFGLSKPARNYYFRGFIRPAILRTYKQKINAM